MTLAEALALCPVVAILRGIQPAEAEAVGLALVEAGIRVVEVPLNSPDPITSIAILHRAIGATALVGAGTVLAAQAVDAVAQAGGRLIVAPNFDPSVVARTRARGLLSLPGVLTPTEAFAALAAGADGLKLFPGEMVPPAIVKALRAVLPAKALLVPTGGVSAANMAEYRAAGANGYGIGSALYRPGLPVADVAARARALVAAAHAP
jgi:2-dehydro-3-deoxyphosphogalactonate aldolase